MKTTRKQLKDALIALGYDPARVVVEYPAQADHGDYATNLAMMHAKDKGISPRDLAEEIVTELKKNEWVTNTFSSIEIAGPGFINFTVSNDTLHAEVARIESEPQTYARRTENTGEKVQLEFISANPTGPLTLANGRGGTYGDVLANVFERVGHTVEREYYINDAGNQIKTFGLSILFAAGVVEDNEDYYHASYVKDWVDSQDLNWESFKDKPEELGLQAAQYFLEHKIVPPTKSLNINFTQWFSEKKELHDSGKVTETLAWLKEHNLSYEQDGAVWMKTEQFGDDKDRVVVTSNGDVTYFLVDITYHKNKFDRGFNTVINVWGADHHGYVGRMLAGVEALGHKGDLEVVIMQLVKIIEDGKEVRMSKRKGTFITLQELIDDVGVDVTRWFFLMRSTDSHIDFDLALAREHSSKNPVFYVQYAHTRLASVLNKVANGSFPEDDTQPEYSPQEHRLIAHMIKWPELVEDAAAQRSVHILTTYAYSLAEFIQKFYDTSYVIENEQVVLYRLDIVKAAKEILGQVLETLGISAPESM